MPTNKETRVIYPGQGVFLNGTQVNRAQELGSTGTLNTEIVNELGNKDIVEAIEDTPSVAITLNTNEFGTINNMALAAGLNPDKTRFVTVDDYESAFADIVSPIIKGVDYGKTGVDVAAGNLTIYRTLYIEKAYTNSIELSYTTGGMATENYAMESDNKAWYFNDGSSVVDARIFMDGSDNIVPLTSDEVVVITGVTSDGVEKTIASANNPNMVNLNDGSYTLGRNDERIKQIVYVDTSTEDATTQSGYDETVYLYDGTYANGGTASFSASGENLFQVELAAAEDSDTERTDAIAITFQNAAGTTIAAAGGTDPESNNYFRIRYAAADYGKYPIPNNEFRGGLRQGQAQVYLLPTKLDSNGLKQLDWTTQNIYWRIQSVTISASLSREQLPELGHHKPYARPVTFPIPISVSIESTDSDTELFAKLSGLNFEDLPRSTEVSIDDLLQSLNLVVKVFKYTDIDRKKIYALLKNEGATASDLAGWVEDESYVLETSSPLLAYGGTDNYQDKVVQDSNGEFYFLHDLTPMKVITVKQLIPNDEGATLTVGSNATQTFSFTGYGMAAGIGGGAPQVLSVPASGEDYYVLGHSGESAYDIGYLDLKINHSGASEIDWVTFIENGSTENWQAFKYGITLSGDTADSY